MRYLNSLNMLRGYRENLGTKVFIITTIMMVLMIVSFVGFFVKYEEKDHVAGLLNKGGMIAKNLAYNSRLGVFSENKDLLKDLVAGVLQDKEVAAVSIVTLDGTLLISQKKTQPLNAGIEKDSAAKIIENLKESPRPFYSESEGSIDFWEPVAIAQAYTEESLLFGERPSQRKERVIGFARVEVDKSTLKKEISWLVFNSLTLGIIFLVVALLTAYNVLRRVINPLNELTAAVATLRTVGSFEKVPVGATDEVGRLANAFNDMAEALMKREKGMIELNRDLEEEIKEKTDLQKEAVRSAQLVALGELAAGVAHEINNPVNSIMNYAQLLLDECSSGITETLYAGQIIKEGDRIARIVRSLLSFARTEGENKRAVSVSAALSETLSLSGAQLRKEGINVSVSVPGDLPDIIAYQQHIEQVFLNLISNARHALNEKYPSVNDDKVLEISAEGMGSFVRITFCDNGPGIPEEIIGKVTNPFFTTKPAGLGTGLGLSISYGIIADHNGRFNIESVYGQYTKVVIDLPCAAVNGQQITKV